jgi:thiol-disulfide isomerase/thioredoxin
VRLILLSLIPLLVAACDRQKAEAPQAEPVAAGEAEATGKGIDRSHQGQAAPSAGFNNPDGGAFDLTKFKGAPVLVNLWASWCAPCIKELPTLQKLEQAQAAAGKLGVIAVSQDMAPKASIDAFLKGKGIGRFAAYHDPEMALSSALDVQIMPTTILYDALGKEVWRYTGDLNWSGPEAAKLLGEVSPAAAR